MKRHAWIVALLTFCSLAQATTYYVDGAATYNSTNNAYNGQSSGAAWAGAGGIQRAMATVAAGDSVYFKAGTCSLGTCKKLTLASAYTGAFAIGDYVIEADDNAGTVGSNDGQGYVVYVQSTTAIWVAVTAGTWHNSKYVYKSAGNYGQLAASSGVTTPGPTTVTVGTYDAVISYVGCDGEWSPLAGRDPPVVPVTGTLPIFDGQDVAASCFTSAAATSEYYYVGYLEFRQGASSACLFAKNDAHIEACIATDSPYGFMQPASYTFIDRCLVYGNVNDGVRAPMSAVTIIDCSIYSNGGDGIYQLSSENKVVGCLIHSNGGDGISYPTGSYGYASLIYANTIYNNERDGISIPSGVNRPSRVIKRNRITHNGTSGSYYGINSASPCLLQIESYNCFYNNGADADGTHTHDVTGVTSCGWSVSADNATECGYTDVGATPPNLNLTSSAVLSPGVGTDQNIYVSYDATNKDYVTAGFAPAGTSGSTGILATSQLNGALQ